MKLTLIQTNYILNRVFKDLSINNINYSIDFWQFRFVRHYDGSHYSTQSINELILTAHEIEVANETEWLNLTESGPFDLIDSVDSEISVKALILFHLARLPIQKVELRDNADFYLWYTKDRYLKIKGIVGLADWIWWLDIEGCEKVVLSEFGELVIKEDELEKYQ